MGSRLFAVFREKLFFDFFLACGCFRVFCGAFFKIFFYFGVVIFVFYYIRGKLYAVLKS